MQMLAGHGLGMGAIGLGVWWVESQQPPGDLAFDNSRDSKDGLSDKLDFGELMSSDERLVKRSSCSSRGGCESDWWLSAVLIDDPGSWWAPIAVSSVGSSFGSCSSKMPSNLF